MTKWLLSAALTAALAGVGTADDSKPNPFKSGKAAPAAPAEEKPTKKPAAKDDDKPEVATARVAHIKLDGDMEDGPTPAEGLFGGGDETLQVKLDRIRKAAKDDAVKALYLQLGDLEVGFGKLHELRRAIQEFRATGKKTYAYGEELSTKAYLLAMQCDTVAIPESGGVVMVGMRAEVTFYKNTLEK
ncbi:MAG: hypothetical protein ACRCZF_23770, partial [Gemmataceae bacterium]